MAKGKQKLQEPLDILTATENIVELAKDSGLKDDFFCKATPYIDYLSERLDLTGQQIVMLALLINNSDDDNIRAYDLSRYVNCSTVRIIKYTAAIDELEKLGYVIKISSRRGGSHDSYRVPLEVVDAFKRNEKYVPQVPSNLSNSELFDEITHILSMREDDELTYDATVQKINSLLENNRHLLFTIKLKSYGFDTDNEMLLILFATLFVNNSDDNVGYHNLEFLYERRDWSHAKRLLSDGCHPLLDTKMIEYTTNDGFVNRESFCMSAEAKNDLFSEMNLQSLDARKKRKNVIKTEDILPKKLFFSEKINLKVDELAELLDNDRYEQIHKRLEASNFRCGFACLFYGAPGTGKTETAMQLARQTGRDIVQVNFAQIKSKWVGDSEKNIKQVFDNYRAKVRESKIAPILLFNEADAVIGIRREGAEGAVDKMENSIQNIILQEMETLDGIMIATTNLAQNLDKAFERRFLYKIKFDKPTVEARMSIWRAMIPSLTEDEARTLSSIYEFSGGQIENIARRNAIGTILHGDEASTLDTLIAYCNDERLDTKTQKRIGF
ncbi:MAG: ATP-binding protein [Salinivirgaceae bacterium]|nr:ATP-binding protein [Salinivirgaceae bacterium]